MHSVNYYKNEECALWARGGESGKGLARSCPGEKDHVVALHCLSTAAPLHVKPWVSKGKKENRRLLRVFISQ